MNLFGHVISMPQLYGQLLIGLINGSFYALLSLGLAVIFGMLTIVNFAHGAFYMMGAFAAYFLLEGLGLNYWWALILSPLAVGAIGAIVERLLLKRLAGFDPLYSLLLTFGLALIIQQIGRTIAELKQEGFTILLVEQNFRFASTLADRFFVMEDGQIIDSFASSELAGRMDRLHEALGV